MLLKRYTDVCVRVELPPTDSSVNRQNNSAVIRSLPSSALIRSVWRTKSYVTGASLNTWRRPLLGRRRVSHLA